MKPFGLDEAVVATGGQICGMAGRPPSGVRLDGVAVDSRCVRSGDLFIALKGPRSDGHDFVAAALEDGASAAMVSDTWAADLPSPVGPLLVVADTRVGLGRIAAWHARRCPARRIGVTGSSGKTTTKEMVAAALGASGRTLRNEASQNGETGVPLTLLKLEESHRYAVLEMGMRGPGQIRYLAEIGRPEVGVITNIGRAHLEYMGSVEGIARAKGEMLELLPRDGVAVLPAGDTFLPLLRDLAPCRVLTYGAVPDADICVVGREPMDGGSRFRIAVPDGRSLPAEIPVPGSHNVLNAAAALAVVWALEADLDGAVQSLGGFQPPAMRSGMMEIPGGARLLHDAYNANPDSMRAALDVLVGCPPRRVAILGDMLELGEIEAEEHRSLGRAAAGSADVLIGVGPRSKATVEAAHQAGLPPDRLYWFSGTEEAAEAVPALIRERDTVLLKGSRGMKMEAIADSLLKGARG